MKPFKDTIITLFIKNKKSNFIPVTKQTQTIREKTNKKIKELGAKYYQIKKILDQNNIQRDNLFEFGRIIENQLEGKKKIDHLQAQYKRMKEALICWYTENFYFEIYQPNSSLLFELIKYNKINSNKNIFINQTYAKKSLPINDNTSETCNEKDISGMIFKNNKNESCLKKIEPINQITHEKAISNPIMQPINDVPLQNCSILTGMKINEEIDQFDKKGFHEQSSNQKTSNFGINCYFDFCNI